MRDNGIDLKYCPDVQIIDSELLDNELKMKLASVLFDKLGCSYKTIYELFGYSFEEEKQRRAEENDEDTDNGKGLDKVFYPRLSAFTVSGKDADVGDNVNNNFDKKDENQNKDKTQQKNNKKRYDNKLSDI